MTVSELNPRPARRPTRAEVEAVHALTSQAEQIRYACAHMPAPLTPERLRGWLAERGVTINRREHASRVMNVWKHAHAQPVTPDVTPQVTRAVTEFFKGVEASTC